MLGLTAEQLIEEADHWESYAKKLREAAAMLSSPTTRTPRPLHTQTKNGAAAPGERKAQLMDFLEKNGPTAFKKMVDGSGIPMGTVKGLLSRFGGDTFHHNKDGRWELKKVASPNSSGDGEKKGKAA